MKRVRLSAPANAELCRLQAYAESSRGAAALLAVVTAWLDLPARNADELRRAVDEYRRAEIAQASDSKWIRLQERGIGTLVAMVDGGKGAVGAIDLRFFPWR